jgi:hypothetical protein
VPDDVSARWESLPPLPVIWEKALRARLSAAQSPVTDEIEDEDALEEIAMKILQLESALEIESPPAFQAARRDLKLRAMKAAIEARQSVGITNADIERWLGDVLAQPTPDATSSGRVANIMKAIRNKPLR